MHACVCLYVCVHLYTHVYMCIQCVYKHACIFYIATCIYIYVYIHKYVCVSMYSLALRINNIYRSFRIFLFSSSRKSVGIRGVILLNGEVRWLSGAPLQVLLVASSPFWPPFCSRTCSACPQAFVTSVPSAQNLLCQIISPPLTGSLLSGPQIESLVPRETFLDQPNGFLLRVRHRLEVPSYCLCSISQSPLIHELPDSGEQASPVQSCLASS